jgi:hypothetical protein
VTYFIVKIQIEKEGILNMKRRRRISLVVLTATVALSIILTVNLSGWSASESGQDKFYPINLGQTGQTACYDEIGLEISCESTGQDGGIQSGFKWSEPRFRAGTGVEADCVTDNLTGLMWVKQPDSSARLDGTTWEEALEYAEGLTLCGHDDWRLPNINELASLINDQTAVFSRIMWYNTNGFTNVQMSCPYASSTTLSGDTYSAWVLGATAGAVHDFPKEGIGMRGFCVWPVRAGDGKKSDFFEGDAALAALAAPVRVPQTGQHKSYEQRDDGEFRKGVKWPSQRFVAGTDGASDCILDNLTGLMWTKDGDRFDTWQGALDTADALDLCGYTDWRIPNKAELRTLINYREANNAAWLNSNGFSNVQPDFYWTSTTYFSLLDNAWLVLMNEGQVFVDETGTTPDPSKTGSYYFLPVRGGQGGVSILPTVHPTSTPPIL